MEEAQAITRLKRGDIGGLETLVQKYQVQATRAADIIVRDRALADDIVQTAFIRVYERIAQFDARRPFAPWFLRMVVNDALKAAQRRERHLSLETSLEGDIMLADLLPDPAPGPSDAAETAELQEAVWAAVGKLTPTQRATIVLRYYLGLSVAEIADRMTAPPGTIRWRLHRAKEHLRRLLGPFSLAQTLPDDGRWRNALSDTQEGKR